MVVGRRPHPLSFRRAHVSFISFLCSCFVPYLVPLRAFVFQVPALPALECLLPVVRFPSKLSLHQKFSGSLCLGPSFGVTWSLGNYTCLFKRVQRLVFSSFSSFYSLSTFPPSFVIFLMSFFLVVVTPGLPLELEVADFPRFFPPHPAVCSG